MALAAAGAEATAGASGRRDAENSGRSRVAESFEMGMAHNGFAGGGRSAARGTASAGASVFSLRRRAFGPGPRGRAARLADGQGTRPSSRTGRQRSSREPCASLGVFPLTGDDNQDPHRRRFGFAKGLRSLYREIFDEKIGHAGFDIVEQGLQCSLIDLQTFGEADKPFRCLGSLQIDLGRTAPAARFLDRFLDPRLQGRAGDCEGLAR